MFKPLLAEQMAFLEAFPKALQAVMPLSASHRRELPYAVAELSSLLTSERGQRKRPYWSAPRLVSAYLRYFLPWNLIRLCRFLPALPLALPADSGQKPLMLDLGSGPLTLPLALWMSKPQWRTVPLQIVCSDSSIQPLELGKALLAQIAPESPWQIHLLRSPLRKALHEVRERPFLITAANVLNELVFHSESSRSEQLAELLEDIQHCLAPEASLLCIEPGTRLGGSLLETLREEAVEQEFSPLFPCTHSEACPLLAKSGRGWCHASMPTGTVPQWLQELSEAAGLGKQSLSLSSMLLRRQGDAMQSDARSSFRARVLSEAIRVPLIGQAYYVCTPQGLGLVPSAAFLPQGSELVVSPQQPLSRDQKSGAALMQRV